MVKHSILFFKDSISAQFNAVLEMSCFLNYAYETLFNKGNNWHFIFFGLVCFISLLYLSIFFSFRYRKKFIGFFAAVAVNLIVDFVIKKYSGIKYLICFSNTSLFLFVAITASKEIFTRLEKKLPQKFVKTLKAIVLATIYWLTFAVTLHYFISQNNSAEHRGFIKLVLVGLFGLWSFSEIRLRKILKKIIENSSNTILKQTLKMLHASNWFLILLAFLMWLSEDTLISEIEKFALSLFVFAAIYTGEWSFRNWRLKKIRQAKIYVKELISLHKFIDFLSRTLMNPLIILLVLSEWEIDTYVILSKLFGKSAINKFLLVLFAGIFTKCLFLLSDFTIRFWSKKYASRNLDTTQRFRTLIHIIDIASKMIIFTVAIFTIVIMFGINPTPVFANFWVLTAGLSLGLQSLMKDFATGILILFEDTFRIGENVEIDNIKGTVEEITLRVIKIRSSTGSLVSIPFSAVNIVANRNKEYIMTQVLIPVHIKADINLALRLMKEASEKLAATKEFVGKIMLPMQIFGISEILSDSLLLEGRLKTIPMHPKVIQAEYLAICKKLFDEHSIEIASSKTITIKKVFK